MRVKVVPIGKSILVVVAVLVSETELVVESEEEDVVDSADVVDVDVDVEDVVRVRVGGNDEEEEVVERSDPSLVVIEVVKVVDSVGSTVSVGEGVAELDLPLSIDERAATCLG